MPKFWLEWSCDMWYPKLLIALLLGLVVVASTGCKSTDPNPKSPFSQKDVRQTDLVRPVIHTSRDSQ